MLRQTVKRLIERGLRTVRGNPRRMAGRRLVLAYHNVVPAGQAPTGDRPLHLPVDQFARQLDLLGRHCEVVSLTDLLEERPSDRPRIAVTFDDAYHGAMTLGIPELVKRDMPVTVFLTPGRFGATGFWWDRLATAEGLPGSTRDAALGLQQGREELIAAPDVQLPASHACATEQLVRDTVQQGVTYGAHTWTHPNLARLDPAMLDRELSEPLRWLEQSRLPMIPYVAYPYGLSSPAVAAQARQVGYAGGLLVAGGWLGSPLDRFAIPRYNIPFGLTEDGFMLRLSGAISA